MSLREKDYKEYLQIAYRVKTGKKLNLRNPRTINEKIQWLKIYDNLPIKTQLTDKVLVRDYVKEKIGEEYLKPVLWIGDDFDSIPFETLPNSFFIKANHGCKWHFMIKDKTKFLENKRVFNFVKIRFDNWMKQSFFGWSDFETQYKDIVPKIIIEKLLRDNGQSVTARREIRNYCFNGKPHLNQVRSYVPEHYEDTFDINLNKTDLIFEPRLYPVSDNKADETTAQTLKLSEILAEKFKFVRVDWMIYDSKLYFEEMTFTPFSGFINVNDHLQTELGKLLKLKGNKYGQ